MLYKHIILFTPPCKLLHEDGSTVKGTSVCTRSRTYVVVVQCRERVATHVVFQQVAQVLGRDVQVRGPLQTRLGPHAIHLVLSDTLCVGGEGSMEKHGHNSQFP